MTEAPPGFLRCELLETGDAGAFYRARRPPQARDLCLLQINQYLIDISYGWVARHQRERRWVTALAHPGLCRVLEYQPAAGYVVREWFPHQSLREVLRARAGAPLPPRVSAQIVVEVAEALHYLHCKTLDGASLGLLHRMVNPEHVMIGQDGRCKLKGLDLGFLYEQEHRGSGPVLGRRQFAYMAPELVRGLEATAQSDIYSLGAVFYELLTGAAAFEADSDFAVLHKIIGGDCAPVRERNPAAPLALAQICERAMARERAARTFYLPSMLRELKGWLRSEG